MRYYYYKSSSIVVVVVVVVVILFEISLVNIIFHIQSTSLEQKQDIMDEISSMNRKLQLLQKTKELEEEESQRQARKVAEREKKFLLLKSKNDALSVAALTENEHKKDEELRRSVYAKLRDCPAELLPITSVLENNEGKLLNFFK